MITLESRQIAELQDTLLAWFAAVRRPLPWRENRSAYGTWISEIMLQQTTVQVVQEYWLRFMDRFPNVHDLAQASEGDVLTHWSGLGYYRRARHLHQAAKQIVSAGGDLPQSRQEWAGLPGIGPYASGAIASLALGQRVPAIDANARRVLTRWLVADPRDLAKLKPALLEQEGSRLVPAKDPGAWNEAVMELGALICGARVALCSQCPVLDHCRAGLAGTTEDIPGHVATTPTQKVLMGVLVVRKGNETLMVPPGTKAGLAFSGYRREVRSDFSGLHAGLWGLPATTWMDPGNPDDDLQLLAIRGFWDQAGGLNGIGDRDSLVLPARDVGEFRHAITNYRLLVKVFLLSLPETEEVPEGLMNIDLPEIVDYPSIKEFLRWAQGTNLFKECPRNLPISNLARKALKLVDDKFG